MRKRQPRILTSPRVTLVRCPRDDNDGLHDKIFECLGLATLAANTRSRGVREPANPPKPTYRFACSRSCRRLSKQPILGHH
jgi:hypothetical protein